MVNPSQGIDGGVTLEFVELDICKQYGLHPDRFYDPSYLSFERRAALIAKYQLEVEKQKEDEKALHNRIEKQRNGGGRR